MMRKPDAFEAFSTNLRRFVRDLAIAAPAAPKTAEGEMAARVRHSADGIGQDNRDVCRDGLSVSEGEIERLARDNVI